LSLSSLRQASRGCRPFLSLCFKGKQICVSSAYRWKDTPYLLNMEASGSKYRINNTGPRIDPCGTLQFRAMLEEE